MLKIYKNLEILWNPEDPHKSSILHTVSILKTSKTLQIPKKLRKCQNLEKSWKFFENLKISLKSRWTARYSDPRNAVKRWLDSIYVQLFIFLLIIADLTLFAIGATTNISSTAYWRKDIAVVTFVILGIYVIEIGLRIWAMRPELFFKDPLEVLDFIVVIASLILNLVSVSTAAIFVRAARSLRAFRVLKVFRSFRLCVRTTKTLRNAPRSIRQVVRLNKQGMWWHIWFEGKSILRRKMLKIFENVEILEKLW